MTATTSSSRTPWGSGAPSIVSGVPSGATLRTTTSPGSSSAARTSATSVTVHPSARSAAAVAAAPGRAASGRPDAITRQAAGLSSPARWELTVRARATGTRSVCGSRRLGRRGLVLEEVDHATAVGRQLALLERPEPGVHRDVEVIADLLDQRVAGLARGIGGLLLEL